MNSTSSGVLAILSSLLLGACDDSAERAKLEAARRRVQATIATAEREAASQGEAGPSRVKAKANGETK
jgi:hypothetical protein